MLNQDFYPTPRTVIRKMLDGLDISYETTILEPSAGKGDILDYLNDNYRIRKDNMYCMEKEPKLSMILKQEGYQYLGNDFLDYNSIQTYDYIIMNPPFSNGVKHLLKAWEIMENGEIVCLLNSENLTNLCNKEREILSDIISTHGSWEDIGQVFKDAERKTSVNVALIKLKKVTETKEYDFNLETEDEFDPDLDINGFSGNAIATNDMVGAIVSQYNVAEKLLKDSYISSKKANLYLKRMFKIGDDANVAPVIDITSRLKSLKAMYWNYIFERVQIAKYLTNGFQTKFRKYIEQQGNVLFNKSNIMEVVDMFMLNRTQLINDSIMEVFFELTYYHFGNRHYKEGWKTNSSYKINKHIIIPNGVEFSTIWDKFTTRYQINSFLEDIDIIMSYITGISLDKSHYRHNVGGIVDSLEKEFDKLPCNPSMPCEPVDSLFFRIKFFKKGTIHLMFKDTKHRDMLNSVVAKNKNWVPSNT